MTSPSTTSTPLEHVNVPGSQGLFDVADQIEDGFRNGEADGWILSCAQSPGTFNDFVDMVVPELRRRGLFRENYTGTTLREHLGLTASEPVTAGR